MHLALSTLEDFDWFQGGLQNLDKGEGGESIYGESMK